MNKTQHVSFSDGISIVNVDRLRRRVSKGRRLYGAGNRALEKGDLVAAKEAVARAVAEEPQNAAWIQRLGFIVERQKQFAEALELYHRALLVQPNNAEWHYRAGVCAGKLGDQAEASREFELAFGLDRHHLRAAEGLARSLPPSTPEWRKFRVLQDLLRAHPTVPIALAFAQSAFKMERYRYCIEALETLSRSEELGRREKVLLGRAYILAGMPKEARALLSAMAEQSTNSVINARGAGHFLQVEADWAGAVELYKMSWESGSRDPEVAFGIGYCLDRQYLWEEAAVWYETALRSPAGDREYWYYKYALALERTDKPRLAAEAYARALVLGKFAQRAWFYRLGASLLAAGREDEAFDALAAWALGPDRVSSMHAEDESASSPAETTTSVASWPWLQQAAERVRSTVTGIASQKGRWLATARKHREAGDPNLAHDYYLAYVRATGYTDMPVVVEAAELERAMGRTRDACRLILDANEFEHLDGLDLQKMQKSPFDRRRMRYAEYTERFEVDADVVFFESFWGTKTNDNPLAIYEAMREDARFAHCKFYWSVADTAVLSDRLVDDDRTVIVEYGSIAYDRLLATAAYVITNTSLVEYFYRRNEQTVINTWHGTPLKTLGKQIGTGVLEHANITRNLLNTSILFAPNAYTANALVRDYDIEGLGTCDVVVGGSPRLDRVMDSDSVGRVEILRRIGIDPAMTSRVIFYAPTWRGSNDERSMDIGGAREALDALSTLPDATILFRAHHLAEASLVGVDLKAVVVPPEVDTYDVLRVADVLITDYSSLLFDFLPTHRRAICYTPDIKSYAAERGLYIEPGDVVSDVATDLATLVEMAGDSEWSGPDDKYLRSVAKFSSFEEGSAATRCLDLMAGELDTLHAKTTTMGSDTRKTVVLFESMLPNGIFSAFRNLVTSAASAQYRFVLSINQVDMVRNEDRRSLMDSLAGEIGIVARVGQMASDPQERYALGEYARLNGAVSPRLLELVGRAYRREFRRTFGSPLGVDFIDFEGYNRFWDTLFAMGIPESCSNAVVLHNQIVDEQEEKFPYLKELFVSYAKMDRVVAVSSALAEENNRRLFEVGAVIPNGVGVLHNVLNDERIRADAERGVNLWEGFEAAAPRLISLGRFSPEKNQELLIRAMPGIIREFPDAQLILLGSGPTETAMKALTESLGLRAAVHFCGFTENPMTTVKDSDLFLLGSTHEGQPMVLLEAMVLGTRPICTDVPGSVEAISGSGGLVAGWTPEAFAETVIAALRDPQEPVFDANAYNRIALAEFHDLNR